MLRTGVGREILVCSASSLTNQHCLKGARGTPASSPRFSECPHSENLIPCFTGPLRKLLHCLNICSPQVLDKLAISHFASSNERMLAASSATQGCNKVARSGRKIEQNEVPKPGPQNRQFCGDAWAYPHSMYLQQVRRKDRKKGYRKPAWLGEIDTEKISMAPAQG